MVARFDAEGELVWEKSLDGGLRLLGLPADPAAPDGLVALREYGKDALVGLSLVDGSQVWRRDVDARAPSRGAPGHCCGRSR